MNMRPLVAGFVVAGIVLNATSLVGQTLDLKPPTTAPEIRTDHDQRWRGSSVVRPGLNEPHFISPFSVKTDAGQLGIAGWTSRIRTSRQAIRCRETEPDRSDSESPPSGVLVRGARGP